MVRVRVGVFLCSLAGALCLQAQTAAPSSAGATPSQATVSAATPASGTAPIQTTGTAPVQTTGAAPAPTAGAGGAPTASTTSAAPPAAQDEMPGMLPAGAGQSSSPAVISYPSLTIQGFADVDFSTQDHGAERVGLGVGFTPPGPSSTFDLGQFVLHFSGALAPRVEYFAEISWTPGATGYTTTVERSIVRYDFSDYFKISAGRYHTPISYWNTAFHHGLWLQTSITRPEMVQFGGRFLPVHFVGLLAEGRVPYTGSLNLQYNLGIGNGRSSDIALPGDAGDLNSNRAWLATVYAQPYWAYKWEFGGSIYKDQIGPGADDINGAFGETITSARLVYTGEQPEIIAEAFNVQHVGLNTPGEWDSQAWYAQVGYRLPWFDAQWKPYYRYEYIHIPLSDPVFNPPGDPLPSLAGSLIGVRYDFASYAAFKMEYRDSRRMAGEPHIHGLFMQTAVTF